MKHSLFVPTLLLGLGCANPQVVAIARQNQPVAVLVSLPATVKDRVRLEALYSEAIRSQLTDRVNVLPYVTNPPAEAAKLMVTLTVDSDIVAHKTGAAAVEGDKFGTAYSLGRGKGIVSAVGDGLLTGVIVGALGAAGSASRVKYHENRLGYRPNHIRCEVTLSHSTEQPTQIMARTNAWEVVKAMKPLSEASQLDPDGLRKEEARALAKLIVERMDKRGWDPQFNPPASR